MSFARVRRSVAFLPLALSLAILQPAHAGKPVAAPAAPPPTLQAQLVAGSSGELQSFYAYRATPLWVHADGTLDPAASELVKLIETADDDGLSPATLDAAGLAEAVAQAQTSPSPATAARTEIMLSRAFAAYVAALRQPVGDTMVYEASTLRPQQAGVYQTLNEAAKAPSLVEYIRDMRWMHPLYAPLRKALMAGSAISASERQVAVTNLQRIRGLPAQRTGRYVLIDSAAATLWMYDNGQVVDSMRVVVGKAATQTPPGYAGYIRYAIVNPYWNVPDNLLRSLIARNVLAQGTPYLKRQGYEVASSWDDDATVVDPKTIDWRAVQRGDLMIHVRQLPSAINSMGKVKYEFPNVYGIYLHDTPHKELLQEDVRQLSNGCIRLEDARRLGTWLMGRDVEKTSDAPEQKVDLPQPVPIYLTYLTAHLEGDRIAVGADPYARDRQALAALD